MKTVLTTLSFGENYTRDYTLKMIEDVLNITPIDFYITTDCRHLIEEQYGNNDRIHINELKREDVKIRIPIGEGKTATDFNFNMKYMSLVPVMDLDDTIVIFLDCDNSVDWWDETIIQEFMSDKYNEGYDFFAARNDFKWGEYLNTYYSQNNREEGIFWHKIYNYGLDVSPKPEWNEAPLPAEDILFFINRDGKLRKFVEQWKWFHDYLCNLDYSYGTWAEGFEIGVSAIVAGFKPYDISWHHPILGKIFTYNGYKTGSKGAGIIHATERE
jgi:hypothetical protein